MIRLSKRLLYTIDAALDVALHEDAGPVRSSEITDREEIAARYLEPVLQQLVREKILIGSTGPTGGYQLGRARNKFPWETSFGSCSAWKRARIYWPIARGAYWPARSSVRSGLTSRPT